jgi:hypothetical protein
VSFTSRWTGSVYPGEAKCVVMLLDPAANEVGRLEFGLASSRPIGEHDLAVPFEGDGRPVLASGSCGKGTRSTGRYVISNLRIEPGTNAPRLIGDVRWATARPPLQAQCVARFELPDGSTTSYPFTLAVGDGEQLLAAS